MLTVRRKKIIPSVKVFFFDRERKNSLLPLAGGSTQTTWRNQILVAQSSKERVLVVHSSGVDGDCNTTSSSIRFQRLSYPSDDTAAERSTSFLTQEVRLIN